MHEDALPTGSACAPDEVCTRLAGKVWILHLEFTVISRFSYPHINVFLLLQIFALHALIGRVRLLTGELFLSQVAADAQNKNVDLRTLRRDSDKLFVLNTD